MNTPQTFDAAHREADMVIRRYYTKNLKRSVRLTEDALTELDPSEAKFLPANNLFARLKFAKIVAEHLDAACGALPLEEPVFFFTLITRDHTVRLDEAADFSVSRAHGVIRRVLEGCSYVGMVEAALYTNLNVAGASFKRGVSWHSHALVWGVSEARVAAICGAANARYRTIIGGIAAAHFRKLSREEVAGQALYMCKGQLSEYRVWPRKGEVFDTETGEITIVGTGRFSQGKRPIRPGDMTRMYNIFAGRRLNQLAFAGGAGVPVLHAIRREAFADRHAWESREASLRAASEAWARQRLRRPGNRSLGRSAPRRRQMGN